MNNETTQNSWHFKWWPPLFLLAFAIGFTTLSDDDTLWHAALGKYILENPIATHSPFTFVETGLQNWQDQSWGFNVFCHVVYSLGGIAALVWARVALLFILTLTILKRYGKESVALILFLLLSTHFFSALRPHMVAMISLSACLALFKAEDSLKKYILIFVAFVFWQSAHASWPVFFICALALLPITTFKNKMAWGMIIACVLSLFVTPCNPIDTLKMIVDVGSGKAGSTFTTEWLPFFDTRGQAYLEFSFIATCLIFAFYLYCIIKLKHRPHWSYVLMTLMFLAFTLKARRFAPFLSLVIVHDLATFLPKGDWDFKKHMNSFTLTLSAFVAIALVSNIWYSQRRQLPRFGSTLNTLYFPVDAVKHLSDNDKVNGYVFNDFDTGGYLVLKSYPQRKPFITGTSVNEKLEAQYAAIVEGQVKADTTLMNLNADQVLLGLTRNNYTNLIAQLSKSKDYILTHLDSVACVYTKTPKAKQSDRVSAEATLKSWPRKKGDELSWAAQASFLTAIGQHLKAEEAYDLALKADPNNPTLYFNRGNLRGLQGEFIKAIGDYKKALELGGADAELYMHYGNALVQPHINDSTKALELYRKSYSMGNRHPALLNNYKTLLQAKGLSAELKKVSSH